ncbi:MAG: hypothetical protein A2Y80_05410 [Deltaproteobacteria bacterium RBG_13_58_19]|nr:MAG: hypothetical protein A2Y80_05410 [Deltaproteobacteria bacterium RBG_13_58_19]
MQKKNIFRLLVGMAIICFATGALALTSLAPPPPYTGMIINKTRQAISFPSQNSGAALIVPARSSLEYIAWSPDFDLVGYVKGKASFCQKIRIGSQKFLYRCKAYDFLAEIKSPRPLRPTKSINERPKLELKPYKF